MPAVVERSFFRFCASMRGTMHGAAIPSAREYDHTMLNYSKYDSFLPTLSSLEMKTSFAAVSLSLAALASAQSLGGVGSLSSSCQAAALGLVTSPFGACANVGGLIGVLSASGSVISPVSRRSM